MVVQKLEGWRWRWVASCSGWLVAFVVVGVLGSTARHSSSDGRTR